MGYVARSLLPVYSTVGACLVFIGLKCEETRRLTNRALSSMWKNHTQPLWPLPLLTHCCETASRSLTSIWCKSAGSVGESGAKGRSHRGVQGVQVRTAGRSFVPTSWSGLVMSSRRAEFRDRRSFWSRRHNKTFGSEDGVSVDHVSLSGDIYSI